MLQGRKILLGVTGSIAAYKSALLVRLLVKAGAQVKVILTPAAEAFVTPLTLATLSKNPVLMDFTKGSSGEWNNHVELGLWADAMVVAPASANTLAKMASGLCDNLLLATWLSARCPVWAAPAMDLDMFRHPATQKNLQVLQSFGTTIIDPEHGELASGLVGQGRMAEPEQIVAALERHFSKGPLQGVRALVTAGPTYEAIDPVRFIGNHSSGKMGYALAHALARAGATVELVSGPSHEVLNHPQVQIHRVTSAAEMAQVCDKIFPTTTIAVLSAAVADYRPMDVAAQKIKKKDDAFTIALTRTTDIAATLGRQKRTDQIIVGFALETEHELENAKAKLVSKNFDFIVLNSLRKPGAGFGHDTNQVTVIDRDNRQVEIALKEKQAVAEDIVALIVTKYHG